MLTKTIATIINLPNNSKITANISNSILPVVNEKYQHSEKNSQIISGKLLNEKYGLENEAETSYIVYEDVVKKNECLSDILQACNFNNEQIYNLVKTFNPICNISMVKTKNNYTVLANENGTPQYYIYEKNATENTVIDVRNEPVAYICQKEVQTQLKQSAASIYGSLFGTMQNNDINPMLTYSLSDAFQWSIDFFRIKEGDTFKVIYEEDYVNNKPIDNLRIKAASFNYNKNNYYAFSFTTADGKTAYYDYEGKAVKKAFLKSPLKYTRISSRYTKRRFHPVLGINRPHLGTDYAAPTGTPIMSIGDGVIENAERKGGNGNYVKIRHNKTYESQYLHLSRFAKGVRKGTRVLQGQIIGYVGSTGLATGPHLCFRLWKNGTQIDHLKEKMQAPSEPISEQEMPSFLAYRDSMMNLLEKIPMRIQVEHLNPDSIENETNTIISETDSL